VANYSGALWRNRYECAQRRWRRRNYRQITGHFTRDVRQILLDDFIVECDMHADHVPPGARCGFIFRAADVRNGGIARYYALLLDPSRSVVAMSWWMDTKWMMNTEEPVPADLLHAGRKSRLALEAS